MSQYLDYFVNKHKNYNYWISQKSCYTLTLCVNIYSEWHVLFTVKRRMILDNKNKLWFLFFMLPDSVTLKAIVKDKESFYSEWNYRLESCPLSAKFKWMNTVIIGVFQIERLCQNQHLYAIKATIRLKTGFLNWLKAVRRWKFWLAFFTFPGWKPCLSL